MKNFYVIVILILSYFFVSKADTLFDTFSLLNKETIPAEQNKIISEIMKTKPSYDDVTKVIAAISYAEPQKRGLIRASRKSLDSIDRHYFCYIPQNYSITKPTQLIVWLHGGVTSERIMELDEKNIKETMFAKYAEKTGAILLYPLAQKNATWWDDVGLDTIFSTIRQTKLDYNIDDNRIFLMGFSDGSSGTFGIAMLNPNPFAAFIPLNGHPAALSILGGYHTYLVNLSNRPLHVVTTDNDELFPDKVLRTIMGAAVMAGAQIHYKMYTNMRHELLYAEKEVPHIITFIETHIRDPFPTTIRWETADPVYGQCMWLRIDEIGKSGHASWYEDYTIKEETGRILFRRDKPSARLEATYLGNTFFLMGSQCNRFTLFIHPAMVQMDQPVVVYYNNEKVFEKILQPDIEFVLRNFIRNRDKSLLYCTRITIDTEMKH